MKYADSRMRGSAFDAAAFDSVAAGGLAFINAELSIPHTKLVEPLEGHTHPRDIAIKTGGGAPEYISAWAANYFTSGGSTVTGGVGASYGLQGTNNSDVPLIQVDIQKGDWVAWPWMNGMWISQLDVEKLQTAKKNSLAPPFSLDDMLRKGIRLNWNKSLDVLTYLGFMGKPGLVNNNSGVSSISAAASGTSNATTWASKTGAQIFADVQTALYTAIANCGYAAENGCPDSLLIPYSVHEVLGQPMALAGVPLAMSIEEYIVKFCVATRVLGKPFKIFPLPDPFIAGLGASSTNRGVYYRNNEDDVMVHIPQEITNFPTVPSYKRSFGYETGYWGVVSQVMWLRETTAIYQDGI